MAENKWQHFVPQFYFKNFSKDSETICGYHIKTKKHYISLIVSQSAKNYFYSKNVGIEKSFSPIEAQFNAILKKIIENDDFQILTGYEYMEMLRFISFQVSRTEKAKKLADDFVDKMFDKVLKPIMKSNKEIMSKITPEEVDKVRLVYPGAFLLEVVSSLEANILLTDLVPAVIINKTDQDFIFSDNPVIFYNLIYRDPTHSFEGYQSPGLIVFCPISSKKCLLLFDPVYYDIQLNKNKVEVTNKEDIKAINKLQFHNSCENIYYQSESQKSILDQLSKEYFERYTKEKDLAQIKEVPKWEGGNNSLLVTSKKGIPEKISLSFVKCGQHKQEVCVVRDAKLKELYDEKMKLYGIKK